MGESNSATTRVNRRDEFLRCLGESVQWDPSRQAHPRQVSASLDINKHEMKSFAVELQDLGLVQGLSFGFDAVLLVPGAADLCAQPASAFGDLSISVNIENFIGSALPNQSIRWTIDRGIWLEVEWCCGAFCSRVPSAVRADEAGVKRYDGEWSRSMSCAKILSSHHDHGVQRPCLDTQASGEKDSRSDSETGGRIDWRHQETERFRPALQAACRRIPRAL